MLQHIEHLKIMQNMVSEKSPDKELTETINTTLSGAIENAEHFLKTEKQQHEQTAIAINNVFMDALDNPKGGKFNTVDEFNNYWKNKYTTNKETLK